MTINIDLVTLCRQFPCSPETIALATVLATASEFIAALRQEKLSVDAVQALARCLPKHKAVAWAAQSSRMAGDQAGLTSVEMETLNAVDQWVAWPNEAKKAAVSFAAAELPADSPAGCAAKATTFSEGLALPEGADVPEFEDDLTGHFTASAVLLSAAKISPQDSLEPPETPETGEVPDVPEMPKIADLPEAIGTMPEETPKLVDELIAKADAFLAKGQALMESQASLEIPAEEQAKAAELLEPFLEAGTNLAETVPGWG